MTAFMIHNSQFLPLKRHVKLIKIITNVRKIPNNFLQQIKRFQLIPADIILVFRCCVKLDKNHQVGCEGAKELLK